jgi:hypothetical protein
VTRQRALYWLVIQLAAIAAGIYAGAWLFETVTT